MPHERLWGDFDGAPRPRPEFVLGAQFVESHPDRWRRYLVGGRWALLPFSVLGGLCCFRWASELFGRRSGLLALALWCFEPNILTWSAAIGTDSIAAALGVGAGYCFWRWLREPSWARAVVAGLAFGLAQLSKMTWIVLFGLWPVLWIVSRWVRGRTRAGVPSGTQMIAILLVGMYVLNLGYAFDGSWTRLGSYTFHSRLLAAGAPRATGETAGNRFSGTFLGSFPVPFPKSYVVGMDLQRADFENGAPSYLFGRWADRGWWYYYLVGLGLKIPLGIWGLGLLAVWSCLRSSRTIPVAPGDGRSEGRPSTDLIDHLAVLLPAIVEIVLVSSQSGFSSHFRYVLPALPLGFVWISQAANWGTRRITPSPAVGLLLAWFVLSSLGTYPHTISYFNELAGGPAGGHRYMLGSSFSWSQDQFYVKEWLREHPEVDSPYVQLERSVSLERMGILSRGSPPRSTRARRDTPGDDATTAGPVPGWHVIALQHIHERGDGYRYFLSCKPVARIGHSTLIFHIDLAEANRIRGDLGLPEIPPEPPSPPLLDQMLTCSESPPGPVPVALLAPGRDGVAEDAAFAASIRRDPDLRVSPITVDGILHGQLSACDVLVVPGGSASLQAVSLGEPGREAIRDFVRRGGGYVGVCAAHSWRRSITSGA